jgi:hypothetical protein
LDGQCRGLRLGSQRIPRQVGGYGDKIALAAFLAAGEPISTARANAGRGGLFTIQRGGLRIQIIWKTLAGGETITATFTSGSAKQIRAASKSCCDLTARGIAARGPLRSSLRSVARRSGRRRLGRRLGELSLIASNAIYRRIGFRPVGDYRVVRFV